MKPSKGTYTEAHKRFSKSEKRKAWCREYYKNGKGKIYLQEYKRTHPKKYKYKHIPQELKTTKRRFYHYGLAAKNRNYIFTISYDDFASIIKSPCFYCGDSANPYNGVDRKDNDKGYEITNCVPCCARCNRMKSNSQIDDFINQCTKISKNHKK